MPGTDRRPPKTPRQAGRKEADRRRQRPLQRTAGANRKQARQQQGRRLARRRKRRHLLQQEDAGGKPGDGDRHAAVVTRMASLAQALICAESGPHAVRIRGATAHHAQVPQEIPSQS
jgi:hypothetical protein